MADGSQSFGHGALAAKIAATGIAGMTAGALAFVSFVDTRTFLQLAGKDPEVIRKLFPYWWPNGRDLMAPLAATGTAAHVAAAVMSGQRIWAVGGTMLFGLLPYTMLVLGEDIKGLMDANPEEVATRTKRFCRLHHVRLVAAMSAFGVGLYALTAPKQK